MVDGLKRRTWPDSFSSWRDASAQRYPNTANTVVLTLL